MPLARKFASRHRRAQCGLGVRRRRVDTPRATTGTAREADMDLQVAGKRVVVTGGSKGIGLAVAEAFLAEGASVTLAARDAGRLSEAAPRLSDQVPHLAAYMAPSLAAGEAAASHHPHPRP